ncbi:MAG TPA: hypothetical protein VNZ01_08120 [Solirubrobacteraceae bacterium]|jgi:hypothetical protein|nr:hypothetical protein [Solirubrobacteraceae bacterium]
MKTGIQRIRPRRYRALLVALAVALTTAFTACGGSSNSGVASKSAAEILSASKAAAASATSVHLTTTTGEVVLDVNLTPNGGTGRLTLSGSTLELMRVGSTLYLKAAPKVYRNLGITATVPAQAWLKVTANQSPQLAAFTEMSGELNRLLVGPLTKGATTTVNGQKVVELTEKKPLYTRSLFVATSGKPYPVEILIKGQVTGKTTFSEWNKPVTLTRPANSIDITQLKHP